MTNQAPFLKGVIEGFYGRPWSFDVRRDYASYLPKMGLDTFLYCPKADPYLRKLWFKPWPRHQLEQLRELSHEYKNRSLVFGVGLSPFELYKNYGEEQRTLLAQKINEINSLEAPLLAILFDDMPGDIPDLAGRQCDIVNDIMAWTNSSRVLVCPTYYSFDPVLEKYFGPMPAGYWQQLGRGLDDSVDILWTGEQVCSDTVSVADIELARQQLGHSIVLWDNYPVNDGAVRSKFLYGEKLEGRAPGLRQALGGHLCNPMNLGLVSLRALSGLGELYGCDVGGEQWLHQIWGDEVYRHLIGDLHEFQALGLDGLGDARRAQLSSLYGQLSGGTAREVAEWLRGEYTFDPACLTD